MTRNNADAESNRFGLPTKRQLGVLVLAALLATSMPLAYTSGLFGSDQHSGTALAQDGGNESAAAYEDFEDGNYDGWTAEGSDSAVNIVQDGFYGNQSVELTDDGNPAHLFWTEGRTFDLGDSFEISGSFYGEDASSSPPLRFGINDPSASDPTNSENQVLVNIEAEYNAIFLATHYDDNVPSDPDDYINDSMLNQWNDFRLQVQGGEARLKVWQSGTDEPSEWMANRNFDEFEGQFYANAGSDAATRRLLLDQVDAGGHAISGQVVDQDGTPVPNATVESLGANYDSFNDTADNLDAEADRLLDEAEDPFPDDWADDLKLVDEDIFEDDPGGFAEKLESIDSDLSGHFGDTSTEYAAVHSTSDWELQGRSIPGTGLEANVNPDLNSPHAIAPEGKTLALSVWDPTETGGLVTGQDAVDSDLPGATTSGSIVVEQLSPTGGVTDTMTYETEPYVEITSASSITGKTHEAAIVNLPDGHIYRVYPEDSPETAYFITVGEPDQILSQVIHDLETEAGQLDERAQEIQDRIASGVFARTTTTTDENGTFELRVPNGVERSTVQAYRADGTILTDITGPSISDLRTIADAGYNGSVHLSAPTRTDVPTENMTIEAYRTPTPPFQALDEYDSIREWLEDQRLNERVDDIVSEYDEQFSEMERSALEGVYETHRTLIETIPSAEERYLDESDFDEIQDAEDLTDDELAEETNHMQTVLSGADQLDPPELDEDPVEVIENELELEYPLPGSVDPDTITPELHWANGSVETIGEEYWSVESGGVISSDTLVISGFPIGENDPAAFDVRVQGASSDGLLDDRLGGLNPSFDGLVPDVRAVDVNTMSPGPSENVKLTLRTGDDSTLDSVQEVEVFGPDGQEITTEIDGVSASFQTDGAGEHFIRATVTDETGSQFVKTFSIRALEESRSDPATVRAETATGDQIFAVVGEGLRDGEIAVDRGDLRVTAISPANEVPGRVDIKPQAAMDHSATSLDVRVLEGSDERTVDSNNIETVIHLDQGLSEDAAIWRGSPGWIFTDPLEVGESNRHGEIQIRENADGKAIIRSFTEGDGTLSLYIDEDPSFYRSSQHSVNLFVPTPSIPFLSSIPIGFLGMFGIALGHRRIPF